SAAATRFRTGPSICWPPEHTLSETSMSDFFPDVRRDPTDIELVSEATLQQISDWMMWRLQLREREDLPQLRDLVARIRDLDALKAGLSPIFNEMRDGDTTWLAQSRFRDTLIGHEGIALVRGDRPIVYIRVLNH